MDLQPDDQDDDHGDAEQRGDHQLPAVVGVIDDCSCQNAHRLLSQRMDPPANCARGIEPTITKLPVTVTANSPVRREPDVATAARAVAGSPVTASPVPLGPPD